MEKIVVKAEDSMNDYLNDLKQFINVVNYRDTILEKLNKIKELNEDILELVDKEDEREGKEEVCKRFTIFIKRKFLI